MTSDLDPNVNTKHDGAKFEILIVGDSRVTDLDRRIKNIIVKQNMKDINTTIRVHSGKTVSGIVEETVSEFKAKKIDLLYFAGGVNDLSNKIGWRYIEHISWNYLREQKPNCLSLL